MTFESTLDVTAWDGPGRRASWTVAGARIELPAVVVPDTPPLRAPAWADVVQATEAVAGRFTLLHQGSRFHPRSTAASGDGVLALPPTVPMPSAAGEGAQRAADALAPAGPVHVTSAASPPPDEARLVVAAALASRATDAWRLPSLLVNHRQAAGQARVLYAPGLGDPQLATLYLYAGVDLVDGTPAVLDGLEGRVHTPAGPVPAGELGETCTCAGCGGRLDPVPHNLWAVQERVLAMRLGIERGTARVLVEGDTARTPEGAAMLRRLDREHATFLEPFTPNEPRAMACPTEASLRRPEIGRWLHRLETRYAPPPADIAVLVPCSHRKPYSVSPTHRTLQRAIGPHHDRIQVIVVTSPLGAVPEDLELHPPAAHYDIAVTGEWLQEEQRILERALRACLPPNARVVSHLPPEQHRLLPVEALQTAGDNPLSNDSLSTLRTTLNKLAPEARRVTYEDRMASRASFQFGRDAGAALLAGARVRGRYPELAVWEGAERLATLVPVRGTLVPTMPGARRIAKATRLGRVEVDDFTPRGTVFAVGITDADPQIRAGDEVYMARGDELRGVGHALMPGPAMVELNRGKAVGVRAHA